MSGGLKSGELLSGGLMPGGLKSVHREIDSKDNYWAVALASVTSKIVEMILLDR